MVNSALDPGVALGVAAGVALVSTLIPVSVQVNASRWYVTPGTPPGGRLVAFPGAGVGFGVGLGVGFASTSTCVFPQARRCVCRRNAGDSPTGEAPRLPPPAPPTRAPQERDARRHGEALRASVSAVDGVPRPLVSSLRVRGRCRGCGGLNADSFRTRFRNYPIR